MNIELYNEDCYKKIKEIPDKFINCIYVDVPYKYEGGGIGKSKLASQIYKYTKVDLRQANIYDGFDYSILDEFIRISKNVNIYMV